MLGLYIILGGLCLGLFIYLILYARMANLEVQLYADVDAFLSDWVKAQAEVNQVISSDLDDIRERVKNDNKLLSKLDDIEKNINLKTQIIEDYKENDKKESPTE
ncbi:hypothetical protein HOU39_gp103 [Lactobacillus phage Iacchus]|jgi:hypothetical protein|uniref:Uncharacterized protein n=1 Tax=Lactobacillus phage Iacchus TaxID=2315483 RepID=A0A3Q8HXK0_9CAUD|nr:hypothetical protein HOU39_gp103 [Lactobacillus phage Iacchus]AYH91997.1 hypothetical protein [Lactobacillus phage Iacchus]AYH92169.1 hypothetical protein [Lactobacillus phage Dionysus]